MCSFRVRAWSKLVAPQTSSIVNVDVTVTVLLLNDVPTILKSDGQERKAWCLSIGVNYFIRCNRTGVPSCSSTMARTFCWHKENASHNRCYLRFTQLSSFATQASSVRTNLARHETNFQTNNTDRLFFNYISNIVACMQLLLFSLFVVSVICSYTRSGCVVARESTLSVQ